MGFDKALHEYNGKPMLLHHVHALLERKWKVVVAGIDEKRRIVLKGLGIQTVSVGEERGVRGPIRGILSGLEVVPENTWIQLSPCDAPHLIEGMLDEVAGMEGGEMQMPIWKNKGEWNPEPLWASGQKNSLVNAMNGFDGPLYRRFRKAGCVERTINPPHPRISSLNTKDELNIAEKMNIKVNEDP